MCIAIPMQVIEAASRHALAQGRGERRRVDTALVGPCAAGDWLLVFMDSARERIDAERAAEIDAALDLLQAGLAGSHDADAPADPGFALPSAMRADELAALTGQSSA
ncbi:HypC/HybG/HupF family hydrogenase formation chaperone [Piscinibacter sp.]|jgi:hydrogenase expression/formation protein HypC|uniref:HypC/HybG/HupF family hydrogenase formation chaperone n=1 Tax=Piscinibacter sp. TaxID=1903157 RepID=UPI00355A7DB9